jgi:hypothetical protein
MPRGSRSWSAVVLVVALAAGCRSQQQILDEQREGLTSLRATTASVCRAWLDGDVSQTYAHTTLATLQDLLEQQREELMQSSDELLTDPAARSLSDAQGRLAHTLALLARAVDARDPDAVRVHLTAITTRSRAQS